jgi:hypothetical protein
LGTGHQKELVQVTLGTTPSRGLPRLAFRVGEAARVLGVSEDHFSRHIAPELRWVRRGAVKLVPLRELERWLETSASRVLEENDL